MNENNNVQQFDFLDSIAISAFILQILDYVLTLEQASNNDILQEMRKDVGEMRRDMRELREELGALKQQIEAIYITPAGQ